MGIHYDYKSTRGEKAMKKEAKKKLVLNKKSSENCYIKNDPEEKMHDIDKPITLEDLTNPDKK